MKGVSIGLLGVLLTAAGAGAAKQPVSKAAAPAPVQVPPVTTVFTAPRAYPVTAVVRTNHAGWSEARAYVTTPGEVRLKWHVNTGGEAILLGREAWDGSSVPREMGHWGRSTASEKKGEQTLSITAPTLLVLRVRAPQWPRSGIASLQADFERHTIAALRGSSEGPHRPIILAEGYDPFNTTDLNDGSDRDDPTFNALIASARGRFGLDPFLLDWGDGAAPLEQQAEDFAEIARQVKAWNGGRRETIAAGISMGAVTLRYALATANDGGVSLGVQKYISINGPHQGAWVQPKLLEYLLQRVREGAHRKGAESAESLALERAIDSPAARELLIGNKEHDRFYADLRARGTNGYDARIPRVAFSNGSLVNEGKELEDLVTGKPDVIYRIKARPMWLPFWVTMRRIREEFKYGAYPGELLPTSLRVPVKDHVRFLTVIRADYMAEWEHIPTFIPTHSALDFPETLTGGPQRYHYDHWRQSAFPQIYVAKDHNLAHDQTDVDWVDPRTGKRAPGGVAAVLYEASEPFTRKANR